MKDLAQEQQERLAALDEDELKIKFGNAVLLRRVTVPAKILRELGKLTGNDLEDIPRIEALVRAILVEESRGAFDAEIEREDDDAPDVRQELDLFQWLVRSAINRPTEQPSASSNGDSPTSTSSTESSPSAASTSSPSTPGASPTSATP